MNRIIGALALVLALLSGQGAQAQLKEGVGLGIIVGEPTGLSFKFHMSGQQAIAGAVAWSFTDNSSLQFNLDYLFHNFEVFNSPGQEDQLVLYYGLGGRAKLKDNSENDNKDSETLVGVRMPLGISYLFKDAPAELFAEIVPILNVVPETDFGWGPVSGHGSTCDFSIETARLG